MTVYTGLLHPLVFYTYQQVTLANGTPNSYATLAGVCDCFGIPKGANSTAGNCFSAKTLY